LGVAERRYDGEVKASMAGWGSGEATMTSVSEKAGLYRIGARDSGDVARNKVSA
jgi:hypothetical protein